MNKILYEVDFKYFKIYIFSLPDKIIDDLKTLTDEAGSPLVGEMGSEGYDSIKRICYKDVILEVE